MNRGVNFSLAAGKIVEEGIMVDILLRLPVKSLIRFKCVCKSWGSLISDHSFARAHLRRYMLVNPNSQRLLLVDKSSNSVLEFLYRENTNSEVANDLVDCPVKFKMSNLTTSCTFVGSCHGLVCLDINDTHDYANRTLVVWNPTTGAFKEIPLLPTHIDEDDNFNVLGFGYDSASDDYKILAYAHGEIEGLNPVIFAMKENYWRENICMHHVEHPPIESGVYANGFRHWLMMMTNSDDD